MSDGQLEERTETAAFLSGGGEMARLIAAFDWSKTSLGPLASWPQSLCTTVALMLRSPVPMVAIWHEAGHLIYNQGYAAIAGGRHPGVLGMPVREAWPEVAEFNDKVLRDGLAGRTLTFRDQEMTLFRRGEAEQVWLDLDYSPVLDESGRPAGVLAVVVETTAKVRAERRLEGERERLNRMFAQAPGIMALLEGPEHRFAMANPAYLHLVGHREVLGRTVAEALPEVAEQGFVQLLDRVYATGEPYVGSRARLLLQRRPQQTPREHFLDFVYQPIVDDAGRVTAIFVQGHDVTDQARAEQALRESEERFRLVAESAPVMLWMGDRKGRCVYLNPAQRAFWGVSEAEVEGFDWSESLHPDDRAALYEPYSEAMANHTPFTVEARLRRADGAWRSVTTQANPRFAPDGSFLGMIGVNVDVTERRKAEAQLRHETRVLEILNRTGAAIAAELDLKRVVQLVTDAGVELAGAAFGAFFYNVMDEQGGSYMLYTLSGIDPQAFAEFPMPRATAVFEPTFKAAAVIRSDDIRSDPRYGKNAPYRGMPEGHVPVRSYLAVPVTSRSGEVLGGLFFGHPEPGVFQVEHERLLVGIAGQAASAIDNARLYQAAQREVSERRRAEEALQALNATLEQRVTEAVAERSKAEEALRQAQKMEAIGKLTGGVAHDFNNLLQVISGNLQLLAKDVAGRERAEGRVQNALAGVARGARLASQLLAFGRRQPLEPKAVNVGRLIGGVAEMLRRTLGEGVEIETVVSGGLWHTFIDPTQLENALLNLAINGRDAMEGQGRLTIEAANAWLDVGYSEEHGGVRPGQYVMLAVTDTGSGMTPEVQAQAFEPFFSTKPQEKGTGLGLSMVYGFVKQSGGHVKIYSEVGHGTTVRLYLPRSLQSEDQPVVRSVAAVTGGSETVLVVEDDEGVRLTATEMLTELGYRVLTARDAASALAVIESGLPIDLLFTDVVMPGSLTSAELARKARERLPGLAVLFTSGYTENAIVHGGRLDPGVDLLAKPYSREDLARRVRHALATAEQRRAAPEMAAAPPAPATAAAPLADLVVLLCEDDPLIRLSSASMLEDLGARTLEAGDGRSALALLESERVDLLLVDLGLPDMNGLELVQRARAMTPHLPVVFATGQRQVEGADGMERVAVVVKPYREADLCQQIVRLLARPA